MVNANEVLNSYGIKKDSIGAAIYQVGNDIDSSSDPLSLANAMIGELGGKDQYDLATAKIIAKAMVEQAIKQETYNPQEAYRVAEVKLAKIQKTMPYVFAKPEEEVQVVSEKKAKSGDKKERARVIFEANKALDNGAIAQLIAKELGITYANAYYYTTRCFKR